MAKKSQPRPAVSNGFNPEKTKDFVDRIESVIDDIASATDEHMAHCKSLRGDIASIYDEAKDAGIPKKELKAVVKTRALAKKLESIRDALEGESQDTYDMIRHAIGDLADTPLGQAALRDAPGAPGQTDLEEHTGGQNGTAEPPAFAG